MDSLSVVRQNFDAFEARDFDAVLTRFSEDWRYVPGPYLGPPGVTYTGHDGYRSMLAADGWTDAEFEIDVEMSRVDRYVMASGSARLGSSQDHPTASLHLVRDGRICLSRGFSNEREALDAVPFLANEEFRIAFDMAPDAMALLDDDRRIVHGNRATAALLGIPQRELRGLRIERFAPPGLRDKTLEAWEQFKRQGEAHGVGALLSADGTRRLLEFRASTNYVAGRHLVIGRRRDLGEGRVGEEAVLTPRQQEVLSLLAFGLNGPETAERLFLSPATVRTHVQNAMHALGARTRAQAVAEALTRGELELHPPKHPRR